MRVSPVLLPSLLAYSAFPGCCIAFAPSSQTLSTTTTQSSLIIRYNRPSITDQDDDETMEQSPSVHSFSTRRRHFFSAVAGAAFWATYQTPAATAAAEETTSTTTNMKNFVDPYGMFVIQVPEGFYTLRRKAKGDLPDEKTGKGRRGSSIFTAGNMAKAEVVAVER